MTTASPLPVPVTPASWRSSTCAKETSVTCGASTRPPRSIAPVPEVETASATLPVIDERDPSGEAGASVKSRPGARLKRGCTRAVMAPESCTSPPSEPPVPARTGPFHTCWSAFSVRSAPLSARMRPSLPALSLRTRSSSAATLMEPPAPATTSAKASPAVPP